MGVAVKRHVGAGCGGGGMAEYGVHICCLSLGLSQLMWCVVTVTQASIWTVPVFIDESSHIRLSI